MFEVKFVKAGLYKGEWDLPLVQSLIQKKAASAKKNILFYF
jgi:hypothetical protein